jgi:hypothetical protein
MDEFGIALAALNSILPEFSKFGSPPAEPGVYPRELFEM